MKKILVVGSAGLDDIETSEAKVERVVGGSAIYFAYAASYWSQVNLVGVVGTDYPLEQISDLKGKGVDIEGLEIVNGESFHWSGRYHRNMDQRDTIFTKLNVFESFNPKIPASYTNSEFVFLANIHPSLQLQVLKSVEKPQLVVLDTMNLWLDIALNEVKEVVRRSDILIINDSEAAILTGKTNFIAAAADIIKEYGNLKALVIKLGKYGVYLTNGKDQFFLPAFPVINVVDPTGAGDSFAGGFVGKLAANNDMSFKSMKDALIYGSVIASFTVSDFSVNCLKTITEKEIKERYNEFLSVLNLD